MIRICVTGANGYMGRHVCKTLVEMGYDVTALDIGFREDFPLEKKVVCNIFEENPDIFALAGCPEILIHLAWRDGFVHNSQKHICDLGPHFLFLEKMLDSGVRHLTVMGTMHEIGFWEGEVDENTPTNPMSYYGIAKDALRKICFRLIQTHPGTVLTWLRAYYIYGDDKSSHSIFGKIIGWEAEGKMTFPFTSGENLYDFIEIDELARQISCASTQDEITGIINVCSGKPVALKTMVLRFIEQNGFSIRPAFGEFPDRPYDSRGIWGNADKINAIMGKNK